LSSIIRTDLSAPWKSGFDPSAKIGEVHEPKQKKLRFSIREHMADSLSSTHEFESLQQKPIKIYVFNKECFIYSYNNQTCREYMITRSRQ
jgi:hypothetical protein